MSETEKKSKFGKTVLTILKLLIVVIAVSRGIKVLQDRKEAKNNTQAGNEQTSKMAGYETPPVAIKRVAPVYPELCRRERIEGTVMLNVKILADGKVQYVKVEQSLNLEMDTAALNAVKQWEFEPAKSDGEAVACWVTFPVTFKLD